VNADVARPLPDLARLTPQARRPIGLWDSGMSRVRSSRVPVKRLLTAPEIALNEAIWKSIRGRRSRMPTPRG